MEPKENFLTSIEEINKEEIKIFNKKKDVICEFLTKTVSPLIADLNSKHKDVLDGELFAYYAREGIVFGEDTLYNDSIFFGIGKKKVDKTIWRPRLVDYQKIQDDVFTLHNDLRKQRNVLEELKIYGISSACFVNLMCQNDWCIVITSVDAKIIKWKDKALDLTILS